MQAIINPGGGWTPLVMNTNAPPYNDVRVRQAMKMLIDRKQAISVARQGYATIGNDLFAKSDPLYASIDPAADVRPREGKVAAEGGGPARHRRSSCARRRPSRTSSRWHSPSPRARRRPASRSRSRQDPADTFWDNTWGVAPFTFSSWGYRAFFTQWLQSFVSYNAQETRWNDASQKKASRLVYKAAATGDPTRRKEPRLRRPAASLGRRWLHHPVLQADDRWGQQEGARDRASRVPGTELVPILELLVQLGTKHERSMRRDENAMFRLVAKRLAAGIVTLLAASVLIFVTVDLLPGDAVTAYLGRDAAADPTAVAQLRKEYGLDRPVHRALRGLDIRCRATRLRRVARQPAARLRFDRLYGLRRTAVCSGSLSRLIFPLALVVGTVSALAARYHSSIRGLQVVDAEPRLAAVLRRRHCPDRPVLASSGTCSRRSLSASRRALCPPDRDARPRLDAVHGAHGPRRRRPVHWIPTTCRWRASRDSPREASSASTCCRTRSCRRSRRSRSQRPGCPPES